MTEATQVPCGIAIPQVFTDGPTDMDLIGRYVRRAEETGYHSLWVQEQIFGASASLEPIGFEHVERASLHGAPASAILPDRRGSR